MHPSHQVVLLLLGAKKKSPMVDVIDMQLERLNTRFEGLTNILGMGSD